jgi:hypothetical protein
MPRNSAANQVELLITSDAMKANAKLAIQRICTASRQPNTSIENGCRLRLPAHTIPTYEAE